MSGRAWCILRTSGRNTIPLFETLNEDGFTAWTPIERKMIRKHRSPSKDEVKLPIMPSFVFAHFGGCEVQLNSLLALSMQMRKKQPDFSLMRYGRGFASCSDVALNPLRREEERSEERALREKFRQKGRVLEKGTTVRMTEGAFAWLEGIIETDNGRKALVCFGGRMEVEVESFVLQTDADLKRAA